MPFDTNDSITTEVVKIKVLGVGGGGNNAVNKMIKNNMQGVEFLAVNTDKAALIKNSAERKIVIGEKITKGHGAGANPEIGQRAAEETLEEVLESIKDAHMLFITCGMGGGTGTGAAPVIAKAARDMGILTVGIVTKPFGFEGTRKMAQAERGIDQLLQNVDSLIVIPNERLKLVADNKITLINAFEMADGILKQGVESITELIKGHGFINLDFADVSSNMKNAGYSHMCVASAKGKDKAENVARLAITSPLLETSISGARKILINFTADENIVLEDIYRAADIIKEEAHPEADIIWGLLLDDSLEDELRIAVIASCFDEDALSNKDKDDLPSFKIPVQQPKETTASVYDQPVVTREPVAPVESAPVEPVVPVRPSRAANVQRPNQVNPDRQARRSAVIDDNDDDSFLKLLNDITKSK